MTRTLRPEDWGLETGARGELRIGSRRVADLAREYGTPLHVLNETRLEATAESFRRVMSGIYPGPTAVHFAFKCNSVPAVLRAVRRAGLKAEVMSGLEMDLALRLGYSGRDIVVNGPGKTEAFLRQSLDCGAGLINVDSLDELAALNRVAAAAGRPAEILLRVNPDCVPRGMNAGAATGSRRGCAFGLDLKGGEPEKALALLRGARRLRFRGFHIHIGTGIRDPRAYGRALDRLAPLIRRTLSAGIDVPVIDVGGGFASPTARELGTAEFLAYQGWGRFPAGIPAGGCPEFSDFGREIAARILGIFPPGRLPELLFEPGRCIAGPSQFLLLTVLGVKTRPGIRTWIITDGGLGTVALPTFYEYHEVLLADDVARPRTDKVTIVGPVCFASDIVYRNKKMPRVRPGEVLAVMDSGAYFTAQESSFGFPRPGLVAVNDAGCRRARRAETLEDSIGRDVPSDPISLREEPHEIRGH